MTRRRTIAGMVLVATAAGAAVAAVAALPGTVWTKTLGDEEHDHYASALAPTRDGRGFWVGGTSRTAGAPRRPAEYWLWRFSGDGTIDRKISLNRPGVAAGRDGAYPYVKDILEREDGSLLVAVEYQEQKAVLVTVGPAGEVVSARPVGTDGVQSVVFDLVEASGGDAYVLGRAGEDGFASRVRPDGTAVWKHRFPHAGRTFIFSGWADGAGDLTMAGSFGRVSSFGVGPSTVWIATLGADGEVVRERTFAGRTASLARVGGLFFVVYDASGGPRQEIRLATLDDRLEVVGDSPLASSIFGLSRFRVANLRGSRAVIAGALGVHLWVGVVDGRGAILSSVLGAPPLKLWTADGLAGFGDQVVLMSSVMSVNSQQELSREIGLVRFAP